MRKLNPDGTLKGFEFSKGYDPEASPVFTSIPKDEDLIDFPCSPDFVRHFAYQGLTKDYPSEFYLDKKSLQPNEVTNKDSIYNNYIYRDLVKLGEFRFCQSKLIEHLGRHKKPKKERMDLT